MASPTQWTWVWVNSRGWWWTRRPSVLQYMGSQRVGPDLATELNWTQYNIVNHLCANNIFSDLKSKNPFRLSLQTSFLMIDSQIFIWIYEISMKCWELIFKNTFSKPIKISLLNSSPWSEQEGQLTSFPLSAKGLSGASVNISKSNIKPCFFLILHLIWTIQNPRVSDTLVKLSSPENQAFRCYCDVFMTVTYCLNHMQKL